MAKIRKSKSLVVVPLYRLCIFNGKVFAIVFLRTTFRLAIGIEGLANLTIRSNLRQIESHCFFLFKYDQQNYRFLFTSINENDRLTGLVEVFTVEDIVDRSKYAVSSPEEIFIDWSRPGYQRFMVFQELRISMLRNRNYIILFYTVSLCASRKNTGADYNNRKIKPFLSIMSLELINRAQKSNKCLINLKFQIIRIEEREKEGWKDR